MRTLGLILVTALMAAVSVPARAQVDCVLPRHEEPNGVARSNPVYQAALQVEDILLKRGDFILAVPEPVRLRSSLVFENQSTPTGHVQVQLFPKSQWLPGCKVITTIVGSAVSIDVYINMPADFAVLGVGILRRPRPVRKADVAGWPVYNDIVVVSRDNKLPLIPETVKMRLDGEEAILQKQLASAQASAGKGIAMADLNVEMWKRRLATLASHRANLTPAELAAPWGMLTAEAEREWAPRIKAIEQLPPAEQQQVSERAQQSRALERQSIVERTKNKDAAAADKLKAESAALNAKNAEVMTAHRNRIAPELAAADEAKKLAAIKAVPPDQAGQWIDEPGFFSTATPTRIQFITVAVGGGSNSDKAAIAANGAWVKRVKDTIDYAALAKLLN